MYIKRATFIALDTEFTGLGDMKLTRNPNIDARYKALYSVATTHAICAFGLSIFMKSDTGYKVQNFHFLMLSNRNFCIDPSSISFLVGNGFDFNDQFLNGIPFTPGVDQLGVESNVLMRQLFMDILQQGCPVVVHNGLLDLMFIYQSFYAELPQTLPVFIADLDDMFKGGLYDTKVISDYITREKTSFLSYLFKKYQRFAKFKIEFEAPVKYTAGPPLPLCDYGLAPAAARTIDNGKPYCEMFAAHGFCHVKDCTKPHDIDMILDDELGVKKRPREETEPVKKPEFKRMNSYHSAIYDAYMTGFIYAYKQAPEARNRVYLIGKQIPLLVEKSLYAKNSEFHLKKQFIPFDQ